MNESVHQCKFPSALKAAEVGPQHKKDNLLKKVNIQSHNSQWLYKETNTINCWAHKKAVINSHMLHSHITVRINKYTLIVHKVAPS